MLLAKFFPVAALYFKSKQENPNQVWQWSFDRPVEDQKWSDIPPEREMDNLFRDGYIYRMKPKELPHAELRKKWEEDEKNAPRWKVRSKGKNAQWKMFEVGERPGWFEHSEYERIAPQSEIDAAIEIKTISEKFAKTEHTIKSLRDSISDLQRVIRDQKQSIEDYEKRIAYLRGLLSKKADLDIEKAVREAIESGFGSFHAPGLTAVFSEVATAGADITNKDGKTLFKSRDFFDCVSKAAQNNDTGTMISLLAGLARTLNKPK